MDKNPVIVLRGMLTAAVGLFAYTGAAVAVDVQFTPRLRVQEIYSDNVRLSSAGSEDEFITNVTAGAGIVARGARSSLSVNYSLSYLYFAKQGVDQLRHNLVGATNLEILDDLFFIDAQASVSEQFVNRGGAISGNIGNLTDNRRTVQAYNVSPSIRQRLGDFALVEARYSFGYFKTDRRADDQANNLLLSSGTSNGFRVTIRNGPDFSTLQWQILLENDKINRTGDGPSFETTTARANLEYRVDYWLSLLASGGYEKFKDPTLGFEPDGETWDVGARLRPGPRTSVTATYGRRFDEQVFSVNASYRLSSRTAVRISYTEDLENSQRSLGRRLGRTIIGDDGQVLDPFTGLPFDPSDPAFSLSDLSFRVNRVALAFTGSRRANSFSIQAFFEERRRAVGDPTESASGVLARFGHSFGRRTDGNINFIYRKIEFTELDREDNFFGGGASISYRLGRRVSSVLRYDLTHRNSSIPANRLVENSVSLSLAATF